jgi:hypothetical protein
VRVFLGSLGSPACLTSALLPGKVGTTQVCDLRSSISLICTGLAVGLDPQGYGNPDFCWLSLQDTLIWSFAGPVGTVIIVSVESSDMPFRTQGPRSSRLNISSRWLGWQEGHMPCCDSQQSFQAALGT